MLHNKTESVHPTLRCANICKSNEYRLWQAGHTVKGVRYKECTSNSTAYGVGDDR